MTEVAIQAKELGKRYRIGSQRTAYGTLRDSLTAAAPRLYRRLLAREAPGARATEIWALRELSFEVHRGEVLGIIGPNGAGKSTLLKIISRITRPSEGRAEIRGSVGSLLEVGTGFHPELSGRENIYLNAAILGMKRAELAERFDQIVAFAEIEQFLDTPVKRYSTGMYMRLAFSIAAHLEPDILIVDEVLAVGDAAFQERALGKMREVAKGSTRTVLFVSHNLQAVRVLCDRAIFLTRGRAAFSGSPDDAIRAYLDHVAHGAAGPLELNPDRQGTGSVRLSNVETIDRAGTTRNEFIAGEPLDFEFEYTRHRPTGPLHLGFTVYNQLGVACTHISTMNFDLNLPFADDLGRLVCRIPRNPFPVGNYTVSVVVLGDYEVADYVPAGHAFSVVSSNFFPSVRSQDTEIQYCPVLVDHEWLGAGTD